MKIAILTNADIGLYKFRRELLETLCAKHEVLIVLPEGEFIEQLKAVGCKFVPFAFNRRGMNPFADLLQMIRYGRLLKRIKPDIVLTYTIKPNIYGGIVCRLLKIPYLANVTGLGTAIENGGLMQRISLFLYKVGLQKAQKVFFQNQENKDFMVGRGIVKGPYDIIPGSGVNLNHYEVFPYPDGKTVDFVFIARVMKEKGIEQYLFAAEVIRKKYPQTRFHVCGECEEDYQDRLEELSQKGIIIYHGNVRDMTAIYKMISCTIHPSFYAEGMSNVLLESCACGRPIITTDRAGCREIVEDGVNGFVVKQKDGQDLVDKIELFYNLDWNQKKKMGLAGRAKVEHQFDRQIIVEKYLEEIRRVEGK